MNESLVQAIPLYVHPGADALFQEFMSLVIFLSQLLHMQYECIHHGDIKKMEYELTQFQHFVSVIYTQKLLHLTCQQVRSVTHSDSMTGKCVNLFLLSTTEGL